jgi:exodeoxyribonuclease VII large subunit
MRNPVDTPFAAPPVLPVSLLVSSVRLLLERHLGVLWVGGEITGFVRAASGHCYFGLKDDRAQVRCVLFRNKAQHVDFTLRDGLAVEVRATPTLYDARGEFQLNVDNVRLAGLGALFERFERLKAKLEAQGWFAPERKRPLPAYPRAIGVVTSPRAAALRDILTTLARRWPAARVVLYPTRVQGEGAGAEIAQAIRTANARAEVDVLLVGRGGGSIEDLWAFNEEVAAQAVFESALPIVAGIGHETDFTICDFVADVRAPTPTAAAAAATPDRQAMAHRIGQLVRGLARAAVHGLEGMAQRTDALARRLVHPATRIAQQRERTQELARRLRYALSAAQSLRATRMNTVKARLLRELRAPLPAVLRLDRARGDLRRTLRERLVRAEGRVNSVTQSLAHLNPLAVLARGYSIVTLADGSVVTAATQVFPGAVVDLKFQRGSALAEVKTRETGDDFDPAS